MMTHFDILFAAGKTRVMTHHAMATQMAEAMQKVAENALAPKDFPIAPLRSAEEFLSSACEHDLRIMLGRAASNQHDSFENFSLAGDAYQSILLYRIDRASGGEIGHALLLITHFVMFFHEAHDTSELEREVAGEVADFFQMLANRMRDEE